MWDVPTSYWILPKDIKQLLIDITYRTSISSRMNYAWYPSRCMFQLSIISFPLQKSCLVPNKNTLNWCVDSVDGVTVLRKNCRQSRNGKRSCYNSIFDIKDSFITTWTEMSIWERITDVLLFTSNLWPNQWSHRLQRGTKWKIWTLSFRWYP